MDKLYKVYLFLVVFILTVLLVFVSNKAKASEVEVVYEATPVKGSTAKEEADVSGIAKVVFVLNGKTMGKFRIETTDGKKYYSADALEAKTNTNLSQLRRFLGYSSFKEYGGYTALNYYVVKLQTERFETKQDESSESGGGLLGGFVSFFERIIKNIVDLPGKVFDFFKNFLEGIFEGLQKFLKEMFVPDKKEVDKKINAFLEKTGIIERYELQVTSSPFSGIFSRIPDGVASSIYRFSRILIWSSAFLYAMTAIRRFSDGSSSNS